MNRRGFLGACLAACAAPAIVRASSLMVLPAQGIVVPEMFCVDRVFLPNIRSKDDPFGQLHARDEWITLEEMRRRHPQVKKTPISFNSGERW